MMGENNEGGGKKFAIFKDVATLLYMYMHVHGLYKGYIFYECNCFMAMFKAYLEI